MSHKRKKMSVLSKLKIRQQDAVQRTIRDMFQTPQLLAARWDALKLNQALNTFGSYESIPPEHIKDIYSEHDLLNLVNLGLLDPQQKFRIVYYYDLEHLETGEKATSQIEYQFDAPVALYEVLTNTHTMTTVEASIPIPFSGLTIHSMNVLKDDGFLKYGIINLIVDVTCYARLNSAEALSSQVRKTLALS